MKPKAVSLRIAAERCGMSYATARRKVAEGTFPVPALPRVNPRDWHRFSEVAIDAYLGSSLDDAKTAHRASASPADAQRTA